MSPIERLLHSTNIRSVDAEGALAFAKEPEPGVLLVPGDPVRPEVVDLAVVMGELQAQHPRLRFAVASTGEEGAMRARLPVTSFPSLVFVRGGEVQKVLSRMQAWSTFEGAASAIEGAS